MIQRRASNAGYTLLEVLVSLVILSFLFLGLNATMGSGLNVMRSTFSLNDRIEDTRTRARLRSYLEHAPDPLGPDMAKQILSGTQNELEFLSLPEALPYWDGEPVFVRVSITEGAEGVSLSIHEEGLSEPERSPLTNAFTIEGPFDAIRLLYFGSVAPEAPKEWYSEWSSTTNLPDLIKIEFDAPAHRLEPPLTISPAQTFRQRFMSVSSIVPPG